MTPRLPFRPVLTLRIVAAELRAGAFHSAAFELVTGMAGPVGCRLYRRHARGVGRGYAACLVNGRCRERRSWV